MQRTLWLTFHPPIFSFFFYNKRKFFYVRRSRRRSSTIVAFLLEQKNSRNVSRLTFHSSAPRFDAQKRYSTAKQFSEQGRLESASSPFRSDSISYVCTRQLSNKQRELSKRSTLTDQPSRQMAEVLFRKFIPRERRSV